MSCFKDKLRIVIDESFSKNPALFRRNKHLRKNNSTTFSKTVNVNPFPSFYTINNENEKSNLNIINKEKEMIQSYYYNTNEFNYNYKKTSYLFAPSFNSSTYPVTSSCSTSVNKNKRKNYRNNSRIIYFNNSKNCTNELYSYVKNDMSINQNLSEISNLTNLNKENISNNSNSINNKSYNKVYNYYSNSNICMKLSDFLKEKKSQKKNKKFVIKPLNNFYNELATPTNNLINLDLFKNKVKTKTRIKDEIKKKIDVLQKQIENEKKLNKTHYHIGNISPKKFNNDNVLGFDNDFFEVISPSDLFMKRNQSVKENLKKMRKKKNYRIICDEKDFFYNNRNNYYDYSIMNNRNLKNKNLRTLYNTIGN